MDFDSTAGRFAAHGFTTSITIVDNLFANPYDDDGSSGYDTVLTSGNYVAYQYYTSGWVSINTGTFDYNGAWWASAWETSQTLTLKGYLNNTEIYTQSVTILQNTKTWVTSDFIGIDKLVISTSGQQNAFDNFTYNNGIDAPVPEPATMLLFGIGLLGLAGINRRKE